MDTFVDEMEDFEPNPDPIHSRKDLKKMAKTSVGKIVNTQEGNYLVVEADFPVLRVFDGKNLFTITVKDVLSVGDSVKI